MRIAAYIFWLEEGGFCGAKRRRMVEEACSRMMRSRPSRKG